MIPKREENKMPAWLAAIPVVGELFEKVGEAIDKNITTDAERLKLKAELTGLYTPVLQSILEAQKQANEMYIKVAEIEAKSEHWLVWSRRPVIAFLAIFNLIASGFIHHMDSEQALYLALVVNGLDTGTRGLEKVMDKFKKKDSI